MIPLQLTVRNFLSYGEAPVTLDFSGFHVACLTGDNGHGKSALLDALTYALWGQARKGRGDRKPDEGLLRLGAEEMQVEFTFELDERRFRVLRSFRRRRRTTASQLDLQAWDSVAGGYRPLSDSSAMARTQEQIDQLLAMDYETFINSAFILQGRADEFTRKSARERKQILGEILGLSRYDRLQERARHRLAEQEKLIDLLERRCGEADAELADRGEWQSRLNGIESELASLGEQLARGEADLEEATGRLAEASSRHQRLAELRAEATHLEGQLARLAERRRKLAQEQGHYEAVVSRADQIEARHGEHGLLAEEARRLNAALARARDLELRMTQLEGQVREARHRVKAELAAGRSRREEIESQRAEAEELVGREAEIAAAHRQLTEARHGERRLLDLQERHRALSQRRLHLEHEVQVEAHRLKERRLLLGQRESELTAQLATRPALLAEVDRREAQLREAHRGAEKLDALRDTGTRLRARVEELGAQLAQFERESQRLMERLQVLAGSEAAACPLCGTVLDHNHRAQLDREMSAERDRWTREIGALVGQRRQAETQLEQARGEYRRLEGALPALERTREELAALRSRAAQLEELEGLASRLTVEGASLDAELQAGHFAVRAHAALGELAREEVDLDYDSAALPRIRADLEILAEAEIRWTQLQEAHQRLKRCRDQVAAVDLRLADLETQLKEDGGAAEQAQQLVQLRAQATEIGYDSARHAQVRARLEKLAGSPGEFSRLQEARLRQDGGRESLGRLDDEGAALDRQVAEVSSASLRLEEESGQDEETARRATHRRQEVTAWRQRREELLEEAGSVRSRCERLETLRTQRRDLSSQLRQAERQAWLHRQLVQAFGKDGIQALVIEGAIPEIEDEANHLLKRLTDNRIQVSIESLRDLKGGGTRETLDIQIADELGARSYSLYSGGEAFRTDFALRIALSKVLARRAGTQLRTLIIDEGFGTQDSHGLEQLKEAIQEISQDFDKLLVVTHLPELRDAFPVQIEVTKDPELGSQLRVMDLR